MRLDDEQRKKLRVRVQKARERLTEELTEVLEGTYGIHADGRFEAIDRLPALAANEERQTRELLERFLPAPPKSKHERAGFEASFEAVVRGLAFTHLNRLVAFKLMEHPDREILRETVGRYTKSRGFLLAAAEDEELLDLYERGQQEEAYRRFLAKRCRELNEEIGVLFDPDDLASRVMPRPRALEDVLALVNDPELEDVWEHDEALGWTYQYYTPKELRDQARKESQAPRNAYEMAFRNQFYTPDYVVRFLTDNTLGRLWLEMNPESALRDVCSYLLVRPDEVLPPRAKKDPREIRVLDPACGSGHFLLYAFDLLWVIYDEAWADPELGPALQAEVGGDREAFRAAIPRFIVEHNVYGIDIDRRASQIAALALFLKAKSKSKGVAITRSGIVCAEPMPGRRALLEELTKDADSVARRVLEGLWERMELAGEAGSLLRMERVIDDLVAKEKAQWLERKRRFGEQQALLPELKRELSGQQFDFGDLDHVMTMDGDAAWARVEADIRALFEEYAEQAEGAEASRRRIFAHDGAGVLRFIDVLRQRYDVVLMNPPFGDATPASKEVIESAYPSSRQDLFACFVERGVELSPGGFVGCISTEAGFFRRTLERWRRDVLLGRTQLELMAHLGDNVLDTAMVRVAAYVLRSETEITERPVAFARVLGSDEREQRLAEAIRAEQSGIAATDVYRVAQGEFAALPHAVFGYWCSPAIRAAFERFDALETGAADARQGLATANDFRFVRLRWEVPGIGAGLAWVPFAKGGEYSPYHSDVHLALHWRNEGVELKAWAETLPNTSHWSRRIASAEDYFRAALTYPRRTNKRFAPRVMPRGCVFADKGPAILVAGDVEDTLLVLLGALNSRAFAHLLSLGTGMAEADAMSNSYEVGLVKRMPLPPTLFTDAALIDASAEAGALTRAPDFQDETTAAFVVPFPLPAASLDDMAALLVAQRQDACDRYAELQIAIEDHVCAHYGFGPAEREDIATHVGPMHELAPYKLADTRRLLARRIVSWAFGVIVGRWDVRLATGERDIPPPSDPFAPIPRFSPGMLPDGVVPSGYPIQVDADGVLVDDDGHPDDVVARIQEVLRLVWKGGAEALEVELCSALGVKSLREYVGRSGKGGFWDHHVATYSKSKRRAPIYWLLQSGKGSYGLWVYYPRLDKDTLYKILHERYLLGRIARCRQTIERLRPGGVRREGQTKQDEKELATADGQLVELEELERALRAVVELRSERDAIVGYDPHPDDGVVINAAPLHAIVPWPFKKKGKSELALAWAALAAGKYEWAHMAMRYWPDRVARACEGDRSLAIAHGLDRQGGDE